MTDALKRASAPGLLLFFHTMDMQGRTERLSRESRLQPSLLQTLLLLPLTGFLDLHVGQIQGFSIYRFDNIFATPVILEYLKKLDLKDLVVVSPDAGGVERARAFAKKLDASLAIIDKRREKVNVSEVMHYR